MLKTKLICKIIIKTILKHFCKWLNFDVDVCSDFLGICKFEML